MVAFGDFEGDSPVAVLFGKPGDFVVEHVRQPLEEQERQQVILELRRVFLAPDRAGGFDGRAGRWRDPATPKCAGCPNDQAHGADAVGRREWLGAWRGLILILSCLIYLLCLRSCQPARVAPEPVMWAEYMDGWNANSG
jgi:hypothetical protein